jgi:cell division protein FtsB
MVGTESKIKKKKKSTRGVSVGSSDSKNSSATNKASNVKEGKAPKSSSSSSSSSSTFSFSKRKKNNPLLPPAAVVPSTSKQAPRTPDPLRQRSNSEPVDLDDMADTLSRSNEMGLSPTDTFDTVPLSASSSIRSSDSRGSYQNKRRETKNRGGNKDDDSKDYLPVSLLNFDSPQKGSSKKNGNVNSKTVVIEHKMKDSNRGKSSGGGGRSFLWMIKPLLIFLLLVALLSGGASVFGWLFKFPSLNKQIKELEEQVSRLEAENDRYEDLNDRLNITVDDLEGVRDDLNGTVTELEGVASALNTTKDQIVSEIEELKAQNFDYAQLNDGLQANVANLAGEVEFFRDALLELSDEHSILKNTTDSLQNLAIQFSDTTFDQNETLKVLKETLEGFQTENDRLEEFNERLETGLDYLNETLFENGNLIESSATTLGSITEILGERVQQQQRSTLMQLEISYRQLLAGWDCDYRDVFRSESYGLDYDSLLPPPSGNVLLPQEVQTYIDERVFSKMCLDSDDFNKYLSSTVAEANDIGVTSNQLIRAIVLYTEDAMTYYFSAESGTNNGNGGITLPEWIDASFRCDLLELPFTTE